MRQALLLIKLTRSHYTLLATAFLATGTYAWAANLPPTAVQPAVTSLAPTFAIAALATILSVTLSALPKHESLDGTGRRTASAAARSTTVLLIVTSAVLISTTTAAAANSPWHVLPLLTAGLLLAGITLTLTVVATPAAASLAGTTYVFVCFLAGKGDHWWDQIYRTSTNTRLAVTITITTAAACLYLWRGSRLSHQYDDIW